LRAIGEVLSTSPTDAERIRWITVDGSREGGSWLTVGSRLGVVRRAEEVDQDRRFVADDPRVVTGWQR